ncbi:MAG: alpha-mannosidase [Candidatus Baltobacteraceae bacterium]
MGVVDEVTLLHLNERSRDASLAFLQGVLPPQTQPVCIRYRTDLGALLRVDGDAAGAFDREHHEVVLAPCERKRELSVEVELQALPTNGLPSGPGLVWWYLNARSHREPSKTLGIAAATPAPSAGGDSITDRMPVFGHSHLDVAWLWTYEQTRRKAQRTFATACDLLDRDAAFRFVQSQPQLYAFVEETDPQLFSRVRAHVANRRFDPGVAALWVESDCNIPSGESLLRQMLYGYLYCKEKFGVTPEIAWLPDTFGFANTLPQLLAHAGIPYFATTKLEWNDTTKFPYPQFVWRGPDGSGVVAALLQGYDGPAYPWRVANAKKRGEPLAIGYGDGGGGVTTEMLAYARRSGRWIDLAQWFLELRERRDRLPEHRDELYLEFHRGVYTTHHGIKAHNALCERALAQAEELLAWCVAVHAPRVTVTQLVERLNAAWHIVLRNQFHDVLPGTSVTPVYEDAAQEYAAAEDLTASVIGAAQAMLPRATAASGPALAGPREDGGEYVFDNGLLHARVRADGTVVELAHAGGRNVCAQANALALYRDKPKQWEAWNIDPTYRKHVRAAKPQGAHVDDGALVVTFLLGRSPAAMRVVLHAGEPFLRVCLDVHWKERRKLLRVENWFTVQTQSAAYGAPHGIIERSARAVTAQERAKFEVPGQRYALVREDGGAGVAMFALDTYGWNARALPRGGVTLGHSLLRGTCWPDPHADEGAQSFSYAFAPFNGANTGEIERSWLQFAQESRVALFTTGNDAVLVAACKPAQDGDGAIVRVRECDGKAARVRLRCGARMTWASSVDALERASAGSVSIEDEYVVFDLEPFALRSFRVRFSHA